MNKIKQHIYKAMFWLLSWLCAVPLASCSFDDDIDTGDDNAPATLQLSITAREEGDLNTRVDNTEVGQNSEYMHNLLVLFIQDGKVVKKFLPDLSNDEAAKVGNLKTWKSESFTLTPGTYTVYAFANIDSYFSTAWSSLTGLGIDESIESLGIDDIVLEGNPASKLDLITYFIPMSAKEDVTVTRSTRNISIGLDRLVSKIRMSITGKAGTKVTALSFGGYADKIGLFSDTQVNNMQYTCQHIVLNGEESQSIQLNDGGTYQFADFYVNSSSNNPNNSGYTVTLETDEKNGTTYTATTARKELPRNSIYPLSLNLTGYDVTLDLHCWVSPIGNVPVEVKLSPNPDYYTCTIPEGCQFEFTVGVTPSGKTTIADLKSAWTFDKEIVTGLAFDNYTEGDTTVKGHVTASAGKTFNLTFDVTWTADGNNFERRYNVIITTDDIANFPLVQSQESPTSVFGLDYLRHEMLNMFIK